MAGYYNNPYSSQPYVEAPAPPPMGGSGGGGYYNSMPPPDVEYAEPGSPLVFPVSPIPSPIPSRDSSRNRRNTLEGTGPRIHVPDDYGRERLYHSGGSRLAVTGTRVHRSNSDRSRTRPVYVEVATSRGRGGRSPSVGANYYYEGHKKVYRDGSVYSGSSYNGSREHSRSHSRVRGRQSRSPSCDSCGSYEDNRVGYPRNYEDDLSEQLRKVQMQLEQVHTENDKKRKEEEAARIEKLRNAEIERKVTEQLNMQRKKEAEKLAEEKRRAEDERKRIADAAKKLLEEQQAAKMAMELKQKEEKERIDRLVQQGLEEQKRIMGLEPKPQRRTYTKFSKVHLCREALEERQISFTEEVSLGKDTPSFAGLYCC